jgi:hypothetical protein
VTKHRFIVQLAAPHWQRARNALWAAYGPVSINGKVYRCTGVLISVMNHRTGQQLFKGERIGLEVEAP